jgi:hypothetical protein
MLCHNAVYHVSFIDRLNVFMLNTVILNVILLVVMVTIKLGYFDLILSRKVLFFLHQMHSCK